MSLNIAVNGLGRIGRAVIRAVIESNRLDINIVAANGTINIDEQIHLLKYDSVHGILKEDITIQQDYILIGRHKIKLLKERDPSKLKWHEVGAEIILECTGKFNNREDAALHLQAGAKKVIVSAPCDNADSTIIFAVNQQMLKKEHQVISVGSCTTNALAPIAKVLNDKLGIESGFMTTIHSYTNDQNILDGSHKDIRRSRACAMSMIPTSTGAAKTIGLILPELEGKLAGSAVRVPTPNVSMVDLCFNASRSTSVQEINQIINDAANNQMKQVLAVAPVKLVSIDFVHHPASSVFDPFETCVVQGKLCRVVSWYDNEWAFSLRMLDVASLLK